MDAAIKMSYSVERATKVGGYPMREGKPDPAKRLLTESYSLYQLKGGKSQWDGTTLRVKGMVAAHPELQARIERLSPVLVEKPYYLVFSHHFYQAYPQQSRQVWDAIEQVRDSAAYRRYATSLRNTPPVGE